MSQRPEYPIPSAAAVVFDGEKVLLVAKKYDPRAGEWGFPGGKMNMGETVFEAAERECLEETGLTVTATQLLDVMDVIDPSPECRWHYVLNLVICTLQGGTLAPSDDAADAGWFTADNLPTPLIESVPDYVARALVVTQH